VCCLFSINSYYYLMSHLSNVTILNGFVTSGDLIQCCNSLAKIKKLQVIHMKVANNILYMYTVACSGNI